MTIIIQRPTLILKDEPNTIRISRAAIKAIPLVTAHPYFKKVRNWKHIAVHYMSQPENQQEVILFDGSQSEPEGILAVSPRAHNIFILEAIVLHDYDNGWLTIPKELITEANDMELVFDSRYRQPNIDAVIQNKSNALITWDTAKETDLTTVYNLFRKEGAGAYSQVATITGTRSYVNTGLQADITYTYKVEINDPAKYIPSTDSASVTPVRPAAPVNLNATTTPGQVTTTWTHVTGTGITYRLFKSTISGQFDDPAIATGLTNNGYIDNLVTGGTIYYYMVKAYDGFESLPSNVVSIMPIGTFSITNTIPMSTSIAQVEWSPAAGASSYAIYYKNITSAAYVLLDNVLSPTNVSGLTEGETYQFYAVAKNAYSSYTTSVVTEEMPKTAGVPTNFTASQWVDSQVNIKWNTAAEADEYWLYKSSTANGTYVKIAAITGITYVDTAVSNGTTYYYKLSGVNLHEGLEIEGFKTGSISGYPNKVISNITMTEGIITTKNPVTFNAFTNAPASIVTKIEIKYFEKNGTLISTFNSAANVSSFISPTVNLDLSTQFAAYVTVYTTNIDGSQVAQSGTIYFMTASEPPKMTGYTNTFSDVTVKWQAGLNNNSYQLYRQKPATTGSPAGPIVLIYTGSNLQFIDSAATTTSHNYWAKGFAQNQSWLGIQIGLTVPPTGLSSAPSINSNVISAAKRPYNRPEIFLGVSGSQQQLSYSPWSRTALFISYSANSEYYNNVKLFKSTDKVTWTIFSGSTDLNISAGQVYYYKVEATEIVTGNVFSKILGAIPIDATHTNINLSGSVGTTALSTCYFDGNNNSRYKMHRISFSWNKNPSGATYRRFSRSSTYTPSSDPHYLVSNGNNAYFDNLGERYQRDCSLHWYRSSYTEPDGTQIVATSVIAYNSTRAPNISNYYAWYFGPLPKIPC